MSLRNKSASEQEVAEAIEAAESSYGSPADVIRDASLNLGQQREILTRWQQAEVDLQRASDEGMEGPRQSRLDEINQALLDLDPAGGVSELKN